MRCFLLEIAGVNGKRARVRVDDLRQGTLDDVARASAGAAALRLRDHLPIIDRLPPGAGGDG